MGYGRPKMKFMFNNVECYIDRYMAEQLETLIYNIKKDWDFFIIITGDRMVRPGKSVLGMTIGAYLAMRLKTPYTINNIHFDAEEMIKWAREQPPFTVVHLDEARESLNTSAEKQLQKNIIDYFSECGQLNHIFIVALPDFFELKENIAVARSEILLNVYRTETKLIKRINGQDYRIVRFNRGQYEFFPRKLKQKLYDIARVTRRKSYGLVKAKKVCSFTNTYPIDEALYRQKKRDYLMRYESKAVNLGQHKKLTRLRDNLVKELCEQADNQKQVAETLNNKYGYSITTRTIRTILASAKAEGNAEE